MLGGWLLKIIESRSDEIAMNWYRQVKNSDYTPSFHNISEEEALEIATNVYEYLSHWLQPSSRHEIKETYEDFGKSFYWKGFKMSEIIMTLVLIKRYLWLHLIDEGLISTDLEIYQALELNNRVILYFDRAIFHSIIGYKEAKALDEGSVA
ncbi:MAG: hypothetical protein JXA49_00690 [Actinobacteria bacterium]|nr:hypothetical protein [Actinomycetota bacterium]